MAFKSLLGMQPSDAGVDVGLLILVDPPRWDPFGQPVGVDAAAPAFLCEVGVVVSAEQGHVVKIGKAAEDPIQDVMPVAPGCWWVQPGKEHPASRAIKAMV